MRLPFSNHAVTPPCGYNQEGWKTADWQRMDKKTLTKAVEQKRKQMLAAAKALDFDSAALLRDEMLEMEKRLQAIS